MACYDVASNIRQLLDRHVIDTQLKPLLALVYEWNVIS
jgi:regulator of RNase E activity RraB